MIAEIGYGILIISFVVALFGAASAYFGIREKNPAWIESSRLATLFSFPLITLSVFSLLFLLAADHFEVAYVYSVSSSSMPLYLKLTALWGGQSGSLLFWSWAMSAFASGVMLRKWTRDREFLPVVVIVTMVTLAFFLGLSIFVENPFVRYWQTPSGSQIQAMFAPAGSLLLYPPDGRGLNPLLRHPGMIIHPPMLYLGFVAFVIPYAFAVAALVTGRIDDRWIRISRRWTLAAYIFLSAGLLLGMRWAYDVLGWGGYWGWDPVEVSALMPWLTGTALLHSVMIQEKKGMMKRWNMILVILTYDLVIFGTFLTRSGVLSSVHAFSESAIGPMFFAFIGITFVVSLGLLLYRWNQLKEEGELASIFSRESLFLVNNLLFIGILIVCFWGVLFPLISELVTGQKITVGPPFYQRATGPLWLGVVLLMGIAPLSAWGASSYKSIGRAIWKPVLVSLIGPIAAYLNGIREPVALLAFWVFAAAACITLFEYGRSTLARAKITDENLLTAFWHLGGKNHRRYGGYIIHLGIVLMALGVVGIEMYQTQTQGTISPGGSLTLDQYQVKFISLASFDTSDNRNVARAVVDVYKNGQKVDELYPRRDYYYDSDQPMTIPGLRSTLDDDLYIILADWQPISAQGATFKVFHNPLVGWLWIGGLVFLFGTLVAMWPDQKREFGGLVK